MSKTTKIIIAVVGILILIAGLAVGFYLTRQSQDLRSSAAATSTLSISPAKQSKLPGQTVTFTILLSTGNNQVTGVDLELTYDPNVIEISDIQKGSGISVFDQITRNKFDQSTGTISYSAFTANSASAVSGPNLEALTISGRVLDTAAAGNYNIAFASTSSVSDVQSGQNVLIDNSSGVLSVLAVGDSGATATASATPTATASATPTSTASSTPTATPQQLLDSGVSFPTILSAGLGVFAIVGSLLLVF